MNIFEALLPMPPHLGPPLPRFLGIYWPELQASIAREGLERGLGMPLSAAERISRHYNCTLAEAQEMLNQYSEEQLLPERGYGLSVPQLALTDSDYSYQNDEFIDFPDGFDPDTLMPRTIHVRRKYQVGSK